MKTIISYLKRDEMQAIIAYLRGDEMKTIMAYLILFASFSVIFVMLMFVVAYIGIPS
jgi:t-SNARE complex subunit (syntaxin)